MARGGKRTGAGRKAGQANKLTVALKATLTETCKQYTPESVKTLLEVMLNPINTGSARVTAAVEMLNRGHGKAPQLIEHTGKDGGPIETTSLSELELARRIAFALEQGARTKGSQQ